MLRSSKVQINRDASSTALHLHEDDEKGEVVNLDEQEFAFPRWG